MSSTKRAIKTIPDDEEDVDEQILDPKTAKKGDVSDDELDQPARKKSKQANGSASPSKSNGSDSKKKYGSGPGSSVFNPGLPSSVTPLQDLKKALNEQGKDPRKGKGGNVIYWMRNKDLRISDNKALSIASHTAKENKSHLIALHILSPEDYQAHDRSPRRIDFILRNLRILQKDFREKYNIPLVVLTHKTRTTIVDKVLSLANEWGATNVCGNLEYEVDELWRDAKLIRQAKKQGDVHVTMVDDAYVVPPGAVTTKEGRPYSVFSPWNRAWTAYIEKHMDILEPHDDPKRNDDAIKSDTKLKDLFDSKIPSHVDGFECDDTEYMSTLWPAGEKAANKVLENFLRGKGGITMLDEPATADKTPHVPDPLSKKKGEESRLSRYGVGRNLMNENGTSHISPYLAAGIVSPRECLRRTKAITKNRLYVGRDTGPGMWNIEISFRDFYGHVLAAWPRVCMGRAYVLKYEDVIWERDEKMLQAWKDGKTGYPIVDASMRQCKKQGYMHNRGRMITAMFLTKHLMQDWRLGEKHFMQNFIDGDFASNNGGWQWSASTGTDATPYFRIFAPLSQSEKSDPDGEYIRHWVPELRGVKGKAIHAPYERLSSKEFAKLGYPKPIVDHKQARERALRRFKDPGTK